MSRRMKKRPPHFSRAAGDGLSPPPPEYKPTAENDKKGIVTKGGTSISFVDTEGKSSVTIETKGLNKVVISDDAGGSLLLQHQGGSNITIDNKGITIDALGGNVTIKGAKVEVP